MPRNADFFNQWYTEMGRSTRRDEIARRALGLPSDMDASGVLPWAALAEIAAALNLAPGQLLVDLGCGRGGYGPEIARQTRARLLGPDFSPGAVGGPGQGPPARGPPAGPGLLTGSGRSRPRPRRQRGHRPTGRVLRRRHD